MLANLTISAVTATPPTLPPSIFPPFVPSFKNHNHSTPRIFRGIDPVFTSKGVIGDGKWCNDLNGLQIPSGIHYVPGPDECTLCVCEDGGPKWCKAVLCAPPQECKSFRVGSSCCDFICLDDSLGKGVKTGGPFNGPLDLADVVPKIIIVAITTILSMSLILFLIHRLRQKQIQGRLNSSVARRCGDDCDDGRSMDFSMDFFDRGPPPPHYLAWWKPPSSYFPPRGEAPPPYEEAIASTSNCLPSTFTAMYNNNTSLDPTDLSQVVNSAEFQTRSEERNGITMATTSLTTGAVAHGEDAVQTIVETTDQTNSSAEPQGAASTSTTSSARTSTTSGIFSGRSNTSLNKPKRYHSVGNTCVIRNETEHLRRNLQIPLPMVTSNSNNGGSTSTSVLLPYPPPYDYADPFLLRHSATLPRHRPELHRFGPEDRIQQRLSLQLNVADIPGAGGGWSSASSSTLSLSTPNSLHGGRPPSLSSSSSSNVSANN